jgi:hypothetical protein
MANTWKIGPFTVTIGGCEPIHDPCRRDEPEESPLVSLKVNEEPT